MADRSLLSRTCAAVSSVWDLALMLSATVRVFREMDPGSRPTGLTLTTRTKRNETMVFWLDLDRPRVQRMVEVYGPDGPELVDLAMPSTAEGADDD